MRYCLLLLLDLLLVSPLFGEENNSYGFRVYLKNKGNCGLSVDQPETFLSAKAIERRNRQHISVDESDLPISEAYKQLLEAEGCRVVTTSKWMKTVAVKSNDSTIIYRLRRLPIVDSVRWVWKGVEEKWSNESRNETIAVREKPTKSYYGNGETQLKLLNGEKLHRAGYRGEGMQIAVIDAGFANVDRIEAFQSLYVAGTHNVVYPAQSVFRADEHGTKVLSCLASDMPHVLVGTAPKASYWLIRSEVTETEFPIEEDYWAAAVEFADSVGVDIVSSSLGYYAFDDTTLNYCHDDLNGKTALISQVASYAGKKGILLFSSAGNEGNMSWHKITFPADASDILTVGAVMENKKNSEFSSWGFTADGRVKPDVVSLGSGCAVFDAEGILRFASGTSFSTPILAGLGACLWQALPSLTAAEIRNLISRDASLYKKPNAGMGYGIPDMYKSYKKGLKYASRRR